MKRCVGVPGPPNIDVQGPLLNAPDILRDSLQCPGDRQPILEEGSGHRGTQHDRQSGDKLAQFIQNRNDLSGVTVPMSRNGNPDRRQWKGPL
jgi:hypothetical protein